MCVCFDKSIQCVFCKHEYDATEINKDLKLCMQLTFKLYHRTTFNKWQEDHQDEKFT